MPERDDDATRASSAYRTRAAVATLAALGLLGVGIVALAVWRASAGDELWWAWLVSLGAWGLVTAIIVVRIPVVHAAGHLPRDLPKERRTGRIVVALGIVLACVGFAGLLLPTTLDDVNLTIVGVAQLVAGVGTLASGLVALARIRRAMRQGSTTQHDADSEAERRTP